METLIECRGISKQFNGVWANDQIDWVVRAGEIHAIVGENGAGKSTLMNILTGLLSPDKGELLLRGESVRFRGPRQAMESGIGMIHQHFMLVDHFTVLQNIVLGLEGHRILLSLNNARKRVAELCDRYGFTLDPEQETGALSVGLRQRVEIIKLLYRGGTTLILDEPTAVLSPTEAGELMKTLKRLREQGKTILLVSHKLNEVLSVADRITILRQGRKVATVEAGTITKQELSTLMVGHTVDAAEEESAVAPGPEVLRLNQVSRRVDRQGKALDRLSLSVRAGEIYGVAGIDGNGQSELAAVITGLIGVQTGEISLCGRPINGWDAADIRAMGVGIIPEDRRRRGLVQRMSVLENFMLGILRRPEFSRSWGIFPKACRHFSSRKISEFDIRFHSLNQRVSSLSGGNQQKIILARELSGKPALLVACQPVRGLDISAETFVHQKLREAKKQGTAILLISVDLEEVLALSDRVGILFNGRIALEFKPGEVNLKQIEHAMTGISEEDAWV